MEFNRETKDWISELSDCILVSILMLLDAKDAVKTSTLSRRWKHLWVMRPDLKFDEPNLFGSNHKLCKFDIALYYEAFKQHRSEFVRRVDHIMQLYKGRTIRSLTVNFFLDAESASAVDQWISSAIASGVEEVELLFSNKPFILQIFFSPEDECYNFPYWLFSRASASKLKRLRLHACSLTHPGDFVGLRNLTTLELRRVVVSDAFLACMFSICSLLEGLTLRSCHSITKLHVTGKSLHLMHLKVIHCPEIKEIEISATNLTTFEFIGDILNVSSFEAPYLRNMYCSNLQDSATSDAFTLLTNFPRLETLILLMYPNIVERIPKSLASLRNLKQLELPFLWYKGVDLSWVWSILNASPLLQHLVLMFYGTDFEGNRIIQLQNLGGITHNQLKHVEMGGCVGNWYEIEFATFVFKAATKLERMVITPFKRIYRGDGEWLHRDPDSSWYRSHREIVHAMLKNEVPLGVQLSVL